MIDVNQAHFVEMRENIQGAMTDLIAVASDENHLNVLVSEMMIPRREDEDPIYWMEMVFDAMRATITEYTRQMAAVGIQTATDAAPCRDPECGVGYRHRHHNGQTIQTDDVVQNINAEILRVLDEEE